MVNAYQQKFEEERKEFEDLHLKYLRNMPDGPMKDMMQKAYEPGHQYLELAEANSFRSCCRARSKKPTPCAPK